MACKKSHGTNSKGSLLVKVEEEKEQDLRGKQMTQSCVKKQQQTKQ